jgi:amino acid adenylation domain-containing protein
MLNRNAAPSSHPDLRVDRPFELCAASSLEGSIIDRFNAIVRRFPSRLAIQDTAISVTYAELAGLVERIATATIAATEGRAGPVALLLHAGATLPAAMLGVLAAGRAYVALDADFPGERNGSIISDAGACAVIASGGIAREALAYFPCELPVIDIENLSGPARPKPAVQRCSDDLAVICYTSGSSGQPKGVAWSHRNLMRWVQVFTEAAQITCADRTLLAFSASVSASWRAIYCALLNGASLHILPPLDLGLAALSQQIRARGITIYHSVPTLMRRIAESLGAGERLDTIRVVCIGGDRVQWSDVDQCRRAVSRDVLVYSVLTSTEAGPFIHGFVDDALRGTTATPPAGRPVTDWNVTIVGDNDEPVPDGEIGEIVVTSRFIALGYWRGSDLEVRSFPRDPTDPELRIYRTGDLASRRPDGLIEFVGRKDQQIKLNGHRIELGEVESALKSCHGIRDAAVVVRRDESGLPRALVAYCELEPGVAGLSPRHLSVSLVKILPRFMVPSPITILDALPRLSNLKIDREELDRRDQLERAHTLATATSFTVGPSNEIQMVLLDLWRDVLQRPDVGCDDDFFLVGGDSLSAIDLLHRIEEELQYEVSLTILIEAPTVRQLDGRLDIATLGAINDTIRIHTTGSQRPLFAVGGSSGHVLRQSSVLRALGPDQPCYGLQPPGMDWASAGCVTIPEMATHYIGVMQAVQPHGPYRLFGDSFGGLVVFEMALQLQKRGEPVEFLAMLDTETPTCFEDGDADIAQLPLMEHSHPQNSIEAISLRVTETHLRAYRDYVLDHQLEENLFRGELTYFYCTGNPIVAGHDRRRLWQRFAPNGLRLLPLPGLHGACNLDPQYTALQSLLRACLNGEPLTFSDPAMVFDRSYRIESRTQRQSIVSSTGEVYRVEQDAIQGYLETFKTDAGLTRFGGWAVEHCQRQSAQTIAVFLDGQFLGYGASGTSRPGGAKGAGPAQHAGFDFNFRRVASAGALERPRLFVLSNNGRAAELRNGAEEELVTLRAKLTKLEAECSELAIRLDAMKNSTCWRITWPLRYISQIAAGFLGR